MALIDPPSPTPYRAQRARSMAADTRQHRDSIQAYHTYCRDVESDPHRITSPSPFPFLSSKPLPANTPEVDLYSRPTSPPLPALPHSATKTSLDLKSDAKALLQQKKEQLALNLHQGHHHIEKSQLDKLQAKIDRRQKKSDYKQMYQSQYEYQQMMEERKVEKRQQLSLPIYPGSSSPSSSSHGRSGSTLTTLTEPWSPNLSSPLNDVNYHSSRYYRRERPLNLSDAPNQYQHLDSLSSSNPGKSSHKGKVTNDKVRSLSLMSHPAKSMYDLRPWSPTPQTPTFDHRSGYESDETAISHGWESLMDTLHSPTTHSPMNSPGLDSSFKDEMDQDRMNTTLGNLVLSQANRMNGNGKYLLILGANGRTGIELVKQGLERNYRVTAFVRDDKALLEDSALRKNQSLVIVHGSPTCQADIDSCVEGQDVVVNVIGARLMANDTTINSHSQVTLNNAMKKHGVKRLIVVTSYGCLGLRNYLISTKKLFSRIFMTRILKDKVLQEEIIQRDTSSLDWTIVRPITLKDGELSEKYWVSSDQLPSTSKVKVLTRRDLAHYILSIINAPEEYHAIRSIAGKPKPKPKYYCPFSSKESDRDKQ
ncbi:hypothetical protein BGX26_003246 [Mortierella sp. AD094]|nr:hypothetical protein BGX26_003246 [Mortierella sp. AD094]